MEANNSLSILKGFIYVLLGVIGPLLLSGCETTGSTYSTTGSTYGSTYSDCLVSVEEVSQTKQQADAGDVEAQHQLGIWHQYGRCVPKDYSEAKIWYKRAAEQEFLDSQKQLAHLYRFELKDMDSAIVWYRNIAESGDRGAARMLGQIYDSGKGVEMDKNEAIKWYTLAAERGDSTSARRLKIILKEQDPAWQREQQRLADERKQTTFDRFGTISIVWLPIDPSFLKEKSKSKSHSASLDAEARGYLYAPIALVSWPAWLLTVAIGESGVVTITSAEHTHMLNRVRKAFDESNIQTFFIDNLLEAANNQLDNPVTVLENLDETKSYFDGNNVDTILELKNGLVKIVASLHHKYNVVVDVEYRLIDNKTQNVMNQKTIRAWGKRITRAKSSDSDEEEDIDTRLARESLEVAYQKLANRIIESLLDLP